MDLERVGGLSPPRRAPGGNMYKTRDNGLGWVRVAGRPDANVDIEYRMQVQVQAQGANDGKGRHQR